ncbi:hypothetical protein QOZ80_7BG0610270 [Eleusine coracana subsp. coracana]|nr:hypothetical protein QOZ80_7BG0610270 [Eleusine coracana subsp. coracana]
MTMDKVTKRIGPGMEEMSVHLAEDIIINILLRLPAKSILRCRAVCKAWRSITTDPNFLATHVSRQPTEVILYTDLDMESFKGHLDNHASIDMALEMLPVSSDKADRQRLISYPKEHRSTGSCLLLSSCNGVLLFKRYDGSYILCNPVMRQWAELSQIANYKYSSVYEYVFYFHQPSDKYKLLCCCGKKFTKTWHVLSTGIAEPQLVVDTDAKAFGIPDLLVATPVDLHGRLHWPPCKHTCSTIETSKMVVFETQSETFHTMAGPPGAKLVKLFCMDELLVAADYGVENHINLWFLEDYVVGRWECRHRVAMPLPPETKRFFMMRDHSRLLRGAAVADSEGNIMLGNEMCLVVYNVRKKTVRRVNSVATWPIEDVVVSRHIFRENLVPHPHFRQQSAADLQFNYLWY